jgi:hypothetical protein
MAITFRNLTQDGACSFTGAPIQYFSGEVELRGGRPLFICEMRKNHVGRSAWIAFMIGPWRLDDGGRGAWVSVRSHIADGALGCAITGPRESPLRNHSRLQPLRALDRAEVLARPGALSYFLSVGELVLQDREAREFLVGPSTAGTIR